MPNTFDHDLLPKPLRFCTSAEVARWSDQIGRIPRKHSLGLVTEAVRLLREGVSKAEVSRLTGIKKDTLGRYRMVAEFIAGTRRIPAKHKEKHELKKRVLHEAKVLMRRGITKKRAFIMAGQKHGINGFSLLSAWRQGRWSPKYKVEGE